MFAAYIARRYLVSKKSLNIINIITIIAITGVAAGSMALIVVLSVFNGFESLISSLFNSFNPDIKISLTTGKSFHIKDVPKDELYKIKGVFNITDVVEGTTLFKYNNNQHIGIIKGVSQDFLKQNGIDTMISEGVLKINHSNIDYGIAGAGVAYYLGININDYTKPVSVWMPRRTASLQDDPSQAFISKNLFISGTFLIQQEFDTRYVIAPIEFVREMLDYTDEVTSMEIMLVKNANTKSIIKEIQKKLGVQYKIADRYQQEEMLYKIMKSEKLSIYLILTLILLIASFNIAGSVAMLIIDKKKDITLLWYLGARGKTLRKIFLLEGMMVSFIGTSIGFVCGIILCILQQSYGLVKLGTREGAFAVNSYPVDMNLTDFLWVFVIVMFIGFITSWFPARRISNKYFNQKIDYQ